MSSASPPVPFWDATATSKIDFVSAASKTSAKYLIEAMGGGVAMTDVDGDGWLDLFFVNGAALKAGMGATDRADKSDPTFWNRLYRNQGDGTFKDITETAGLRGSGYGQGVAVGDCDNDGRADLFVTALGGNTLYRNKGGAVFEDVTAQAGVMGDGWSTSAGFIDYDRDGNLDLFVARYLNWDYGKNKPCGEPQAYCHPNEFAPVTHLLYRGLGGCRFVDVSAKAGITKSPGKGLGVAFQDVDHDGWPDIFVANDSFPQQLFRNQRNGTFEEIALAPRRDLDHGFTEDRTDDDRLAIDRDANLLAHFNRRDDTAALLIELHGAHRSDSQAGQRDGRGRIEARPGIEVNRQHIPLVQELLQVAKLHDQPAADS